jgi:hypothetical protein
MFFIVVNRGNTLMKSIVLISSLLLLNPLTTDALAATCSATLPIGATQVVGTALNTLLESHTVCVGNASPWQAQEYHQTPSGAVNNLIDYHQGSVANDPTAPVGFWTISGDKVSYTYHGSVTAYNDEVYDNHDATYTFCDQSNNITTASKILSGQVGC